MKTLILKRLYEDHQEVVAVGINRRALRKKARARTLPRLYFGKVDEYGCEISTEIAYDLPADNYCYCIHPVPWCGPDPLKQAADALADALTVIRLAQSTP